MRKRAVVATFAVLVLSLTVVAGVPELRSAGTTWRLADGTAISADASFIPPVLLALPQPKYPADATEDDSEVAIEVIVGIGGRTAATSILRTDAPDLVTSAVEAAEQALFKPALLNGKRVAVRYELRFNRKFE